MLTLTVLPTVPAFSVTTPDALLKSAPVAAWVGRPGVAVPGAARQATATFAVAGTSRVIGTLSVRFLLCPSTTAMSPTDAAGWAAALACGAETSNPPATSANAVAPATARRRSTLRISAPLQLSALPGTLLMVLQATVSRR